MTYLQDPTIPSTAPAQAAAVVENNFSPIIQNNITIQTPPPAPAPSGRRSGGTRQHRARPEAEARPTPGFELNASTVNVEAMRAQQNDTGRDNVYVDIEAQASVYTVSEERRRRPGGNQSIQSVGAVADMARSANTRAFVSSAQNASTTTLEGFANGTVMLTERKNGVVLRTDITGFSPEVTAAGIRLLQQNTASDGEVDRVEQQLIINLVTTAKEVAAARRH